MWINGDRFCSAEATQRRCATHEAPSCPSPLSRWGRGSSSGSLVIVKGFPEPRLFDGEVPAEQQAWPAGFARQWRHILLGGFSNFHESKPTPRMMKET